MIEGLGMYCIGGVALGLILSVVIAVVKLRLEHETKRLKREEQARLLAWEQDEDEHLAASRLRLREMTARKEA